MDGREQQQGDCLFAALGNGSIGLGSGGDDGDNGIDLEDGGER